MTEPLPEYRDRLLSRLESVVPDIADSIAAIPESRWHEPMKRGARSPHAIVAHLRDVEQHASIVRVKRLLNKDSPEFESFDPEAWEAEHYNASEPMTALLADYAGLREAELQLLRSLTPQGWARTGRHVTFGLRTVQWWAERILQHAEDHLGELRER